MFIKRFVFLFITSCFFILFNQQANAQVAGSGVAVGDTTGKKLEILEAKRYNFQKIDSTGDFLSLAGNVRIRQGNTLFYCDSAVLNQKQNIVEAFGNIHINDEDSIHTYSQYLKYYGKEKDAILKNKVKLTDGKGVLTTNELNYNTFTKIGTYVNGGKVVTGTTVLTSSEGIYYGETRDIYFKKKVVMTDPDFKLTTDTLLYNTFTEIARFTVPTVIKTKDRTVTTSEGFYDMQNRKAVFGKRPTIDDKDYTLIANDIAIDEKSGFGDAIGNAVYKSKDTANTSIIIANRLQSNNITKALLATQKPVMILKQGADSVFIAADTLYTARLTDLQKSRTVPVISQFNRSAEAVDSIKEDFSDTLISTADTVTVRNVNPRLTARGLRGLQVTPQPVADSNNVTQSANVNSPVADSLQNKIVRGDSTVAANAPDSNSNRFIEAYYNVKIYSDSLQAVGDSMFYSLQDSAFRLFKDPIVWAQDNQITGDTIYLFTKNRKPERMYVFENALAVNKVEAFYNQVKGTVMNTYFVDGNISTIKAKGSAENIYYAADEGGSFIGVNQSTCDVIDMYFADKRPKKIVFRNNLQGTTYPMQQVKHGEMRLRGFKWLDERRPKSGTELFGN